jgi:Fic family protein
MKYFSLKQQSKELLTPEIVSLLSSVEKLNGHIYNLPNRKKLNRLHDLSKRRSVTSSNKIEGIEVSKKREEQLLLDHANPETKEDYELLGYNKALTYMMENYQHLSLSEKTIKDFHYYMYEDYMPIFGGKYKTIPNYINSYDSKGNFVGVAFTPSDPEDVEQQLGNLIWQFNDACSSPDANILVLIFIFVFEFLCIHPFPDGNGRVSRLLTSFLLLKHGYALDNYYSLSYLILEHLDDYYKALHLSGIGWHENKNDPYAFVHYHLVRLVEGYLKLDYIMKTNDLNGTCEELVYKVIGDNRMPTSKEYIEEILYKYSRTSIERALAELTTKKRIQFVSKGHASKYIVNN